MSDETAQQKADRQARLSHAMGVMFLQDKVDKLERDASKITYPRSLRQSKSGPAADLTSSSTRYDSAHTYPKPRALTGPGISPAAGTPTNRVQDAASATHSIRLVDASVLIFSLRSVHNWSRDQSTCVVIPLEAINTLDLLKKGDDPINLAARKATRWLEDKIGIFSQDGDTMLTQPAPGIFAQKEHFRASPTQIENARAASLASRQPDAAAEGPSLESRQDSPGLESQTAKKDMFSASDAPRYMRELLSVCLYCHEVALPASDFAVAIAYPPAHLQDKMIEAHDTLSYLYRVDGRATEAWLDAYRIPFDVAPTSKTWTGEKLSSRFRADITGAYHAGSHDDLAGSKEYSGQQRRKGSPTPSASSSTSSFKSEFSGLSMLTSHKSPRHRPESRFAHPTAPLRCVRGISTSVTASEPATDASTHSLSASEDTEGRDDSDDIDGPIIARPSSAASSHTSFVSSLTTSTQEDWSSQTSASISSHGGSRMFRHGPSSSASTPSALDPGPNAPLPTMEGGATPPGARLTTRTLHKTKSGANKMEEYLRRLEIGAASNSSSSAAAGTATPTNRHG